MTTYTGDRNPNWRGGRVACICVICGANYEVTPALLKTTKCCSRKCLSKYALSKVKPRLDRPTKTPKVKFVRSCKVCGEGGVKKGRKMHPACRPIPKHSKILRVCIDCGDQREIVVKNDKPNSRCIACEYKNRAGASNSRWKGGITPDNKRIRGSKAYALWRLAVFKRDHYTCQICCQVGGELNADHILPFSSYPELRLELSNGRTLCKPCHELTPTYRRGGRSVDDLEAVKSELGVV